MSYLTGYNALGKSLVVCRPYFLKACAVDLAGIWDDNYHNPTDCLFGGYILLELLSIVEEICRQQISSLQMKKLSMKASHIRRNSLPPLLSGPQALPSLR